MIAPRVAAAAAPDAAGPRLVVQAMAKKMVMPPMVYSQTTKRESRRMRPINASSDASETRSTNEYALIQGTTCSSACPIADLLDSDATVAARHAEEVGMASRFMIGLSLVAIILAGCGAAGSPSVEASAAVVPSLAAESASPSAAATVPAEWKTYTSDRYGYAIDAPSDWIATPAAKDWPPTGESYPDDNAIDKWALPPGDPNWVLMFVSSIALSPGELPADRIAKLDADNAQFCQLSNRRDVTTGGVPARREDGKCFGSDSMDQVALVNGDRFYLIYLLSAQPFSETSKATFEHFLGSFKLL